MPSPSRLTKSLKPSRLVWLMILLLGFVGPISVRAGGPFTTLRFGNIDTTIVSGNLAGGNFTGNITWGPVTNLAVGPIPANDIGSGIAEVTGGSVNLTFPQPYNPSPGNWNYFATSATLSVQGARAQIAVALPAAVLFKAQNSDPFYHETRLPLGNQFLDQQARIAGSIGLATLVQRIKPENEPFSIGVSAGGTFSDAAGFVFNGATLDYEFEDEFADLPGERPSNTPYLWFGQFTTPVTIGTNGIAFTATHAGAHSYQFAFPTENVFQDVQWSITYNNGITSGSVTAADSLQAYKSDPCGGGPGSLPLGLGAVTFLMGADWGLLGVPDPTTTEISFDAYEIPSIDAPGVFYVPGVRTAGDALVNNKLPQEYLLAGRNSIQTTQGAFASFGEAGYTQGTGSYAGWNLAVADLFQEDFTANLACVPAPFTSNASKVYVRAGGVSGTLEASDASVTALPPLLLYGSYETELTRFNICFLDNHQWQESAVDGRLTLDFPADTDFEFKSMEIDTCGSPGAAKIKTFSNTLAYWNRDFKFRGIEFKDVLDNGGDPVMASCGIPLRTLWTKSSNSIPELQKSLLVDTNFKGNGDIEECIVSGEPGNKLQEWPYTVRKVYYTGWDGTQDLNGKTVVVGDMKLPFWGATPVVALYDIGAIPQVFDGRSYAAEPAVDIDPDGNGFPAGISSIDQYLNSTSHRPIVRSSFANIIPLEYKVKYNNVQRRFATANGEANERDLVVMSINSSVRGITRNDTEILFAAEFGIPELNIASLLEDFTDPAIQQLLGPLKTRMDTVNDSLSGSFGNAIRTGMENLTRPAVTQMVNQIRTAAANAEGALSAGELGAINGIIDQRMGLLQTSLKVDLNSETGPIIGRIDQILDGLEQVEQTIDQLDPEAVKDVMSALIGLAGGDPSGVEMVFEDVEAARAYIVDNLIKEQLRPQLEALRSELDDLGTIPEISEMLQGTEFAGAMDDVRGELKEYVNQLKASGAAVRNLDPEQVNTRLVNTIYNSFFFDAVNQLVTQLFEPLKAQAQNVLNGLFDSLNNQVRAYLELAGEALSSVTKKLDDIRGVAAGEISGYAVFGGESLDRLHVDAEFSVEATDKFSFRGSLDMERFVNNSNGEVCGVAAGAESIKTKIAVYDIPLKMPRADLRADQIALMLRLNQNDQKEFYLSDVAGLIETTGKLNFEAAKVVSPSFSAGVGENETYIAFVGTIVFSSRSMRGGIFLGKTCNGVEILEAIDPDVEGLFTQNEISGIYAFGEAAIPIVDYTCALRVGATAGAGFWFFTEGPSYGGKMTAGVYGEGLCIVSVRGKVTLIGGKEASGYFFKGTGWVAGGIGWCEPEEWFQVDDVWADRWCATCVLWLQVMYKNGWSVDKSAECHL